MRTDHEIFNKPTKVKLTIENEPTPEYYSRSSRGEDLDKTMPMWRVQTEGCSTHRRQNAGIVSSDIGFLDSPDTEFISSGVNTKGPKAIAIARHGNFLQWGFAASPAYLTDEAKDVFCNALHYISKFEGQTPIARKTKGTLTRAAIDNAIERLSEEGYARTVKFHEKMRKETEEMKAELQKRIDDGEEVPEDERDLLNYPDFETPSRIDAASGLVSPETLEELDNDPTKVAEYLRRVKPYFHSVGWYELKIDEDLMKLKIGNNDPQLLEKAIELLDSDSPQQKKLGGELLNRYTDESFETAKQWANWLKANRKKLFFTEAGGFKWLVNEPRSARKKMKAETTKTQEPVPNEAGFSDRATAQTPFVSGMTIEKDGDEYVLKVHVDIFAGWHAYHIVPAGSPYQPISLKLELPDGVRQTGEWNRPTSSRYVADPRITIYEETNLFSCRLAVENNSKGGEVACEIFYQVCDDQRCRRPSSHKHKVTINR